MRSLQTGYVERVRSLERTDGRTNEREAGRIVYLCSCHLGPWPISAAASPQTMQPTSQYKFASILLQRWPRVSFRTTNVVSVSSEQSPHRINVSTPESVSPAAAARRGGS